MTRLDPRVLVLAAAALVEFSCGARRSPPDAVIYTDNSFQLYTRGDSLARVVHCGVPVQDFSVAPDGHSVVFSSTEDAHAAAGQIYRLDLESRQIEKLTQGPFAFKYEEPSKERELYAIPEVSPDGKLVAFAARSVAGDDRDDAIGLAGPIAILDLASKQARILRSTEDVDGLGPAFAGSIAWSPDSTRLLLELEVQGAIAAIDGSELQWLESFLPAKFREGQAAPVAWWSNSEVAFIWSPTELWNASVAKIFKLDLKDGGAVDSGLLKERNAPLRNVGRIDCNRQFVLITHQGGAELLTPNGDQIQHWDTAKVRLRAR